MERRRRRSVASPLATVAVLLLAGCGGGEEAPSSSGDPFVNRGNEICRELGRELNDLGPPPGQTGSTAFRRHERQVEAASEKAFAELRALRPPQRLEQARNQFFVAVELQRRHADELAQAARAAEGSGDRATRAQGEVNRLINVLQEDTRRAQARLNELGWTDCVNPGR